MRVRTLLPLLVLSLVVSACGEGEPTLVGDGVLLRYAYAPGDQLSYEIDQQMDMTMEGSGDVAALGALDATMNMDMTMRVDYSVAEGPDPDTVEVTIATTVAGGSGTMESLGQVQQIPFEELAAQGSTEVTVVLDPQGTPVSVSVGGESLPADLFGDLQGATGFGELASPQHMGPQFPDGPIEVGSEWTTSTETSTFGIDINTSAEHRVAAVEDVAGRSTYRIESVIVTDGFEMSLEEIMQAVLDSGAELGGDSDEMEAAVAMFETLGIEAIYRIDDMTLEMTSWFDAAEGIVVRVDTSLPMTMDVEMSGMPDVGDITMAMDIDLRQVMQLTE